MQHLLELLESRDDIPRWDRVAIHQDFHFVPIGFAGLPALESTLRQLWDHTDHDRSLHFFHDGHAPLVYDDHHELVDACALGDGEGAAAVMDRHRAHVLERVRGAMLDETSEGVAT